jgi:hypothetical protein
MAALTSTRPYRRGAPPSLPDEGRYVAAEFKKIEDALKGLGSASADLTPFLRFDTAQTKTATEHMQAWANLGVNTRILPSIIAAQTTVLDAAADTLIVSGYASAGDGGWGMWKVVSGEPAHSGKKSHVSGKWLELVETVARPELLGAFGNGVACDSEMAAIADYALYRSSALYLSAGTYRLTDTLAPNGKLSIFGSGKTNSIILSSASGPAIYFNTALHGYDGAASVWVGHQLRDFGVVPTVDNGGDIGIRIDTAASRTDIPTGTGDRVDYDYSYAVIDNIYIGLFANYGFLFDNDTAQNFNGMYTSTISKCYINNGVGLLRVTDSVHVVGCTFHGNGLFYFWSNGGSNFSVRDCNITLKNGAYFQDFVCPLIFENNQCEHPYEAAWQNFTAGGRTGWIEFHNCNHVSYRSNKILPQWQDGAYTRAAAALHFSGTCDRILLEGTNYFDLGKGATYHVSTSSFTGRIDIRGSMKFGGQFGTSDVASLSLNASEIRGWPVDLTPNLANGWTSNRTKVWVYKDPDGGRTRLRGDLTAGTMDAVIVNVNPAYRPLGATYLLARGTGGTRQCTIFTNGDVKIFSEAAGAVLDGLSWDTEFN